MKATHILLVLGITEIILLARDPKVGTKYGRYSVSKWFQQFTWWAKARLGSEMLFPSGAQA